MTLRDTVIRCTATNYNRNDLNGDGRKEVILCGVNNAFGMAFVAVLDPGHIDGYSPANGEYLPEGYDMAERMSYVLIPMTKAGRSIPVEKNYNQARRIAVMEQEEVIRVYIRDFEQYNGAEADLRYFCLAAYNILVKRARSE